MTIQEMHYDFKRKFEVIDSQQRKRLLPQEIDMMLTEAQLVFVKNRYTRGSMGLEAGQRDLSDIRTLIVPDYSANISGKVAELAPDNMYFMNAKVVASKPPCAPKTFRVYVEQQDDLHESNYFAKSSFEWEEVTGELNQDGLLLYFDDFLIENCYITYIKRPQRVYMASTPYRLPSGEVLTGNQNSELPEHVHPDIVDLAVVMARISETSSLPSDQLKNQFNNI